MFSNHFISLKNKLIVIILPVIILAIVIISSLTFQKISEILYDNHKTLMNVKNEKDSDNIESFIIEMLSSLETIKKALEGANFNSKEELRFLMSVPNENYPTGIYIGDNKGNFINSLGLIPEENFIPSERNWYIEGLNNDNFKFGKPYQDSVTKEIVLSASAKLKTINNSERIVSADIQGIKLIEKLEEIKEENVISFILDKSTNIVLASVNSNLLTVDGSVDIDKALLSNINNLDAMSSATLDISRDTNVNSINIDEYIVSRALIKNTNWEYISLTPLKILNDRISNIKLLVTIVAGTAIIFLTIYMRFIIGKMLKPLNNLTNTIEKITNGDFSSSIEIKGNDEIYLINNNLNNFIEKMRNIILEITNISEKMTLQSNNNQEVSEFLKNSSKNQFELIEELNLTIDEISTSIGEVSENISNLAINTNDTNNMSIEVNELILNTVNISEKGKEDVENLIISNNSVEESIYSLENSINKVGDYAKKIFNIVKIIKDISSQVTLLGLNASIEAARAGNAGLGFAVVASEIQKLSIITNNSTTEISVIINDINNLINDAIKKTKDSEVNMNKNKESLTKTTESFNNIYNEITEANKKVLNITEKIKEINDISMSVAGITQEQYASTENILASTEYIYEKSQKLNDSGKVINAEADKLNNLANELNDNMKNFKL